MPTLTSEFGDFKERFVTKSSAVKAREKGDLLFHPLSYVPAPRWCAGKLIFLSFQPLKAAPFLPDAFHAS